MTETLSAARHAPDTQSKPLSPNPFGSNAQSSIFQAASVLNAIVQLEGALGEHNR